MTVETELATADVREVASSAAAPESAAEKAPRAGLSLPPGILATLVVVGLLWLSIGAEMLHAWKSDKALSHGPLVPLIAGALLWLRKDELKEWKSAEPLGLAALLGSTLLFVLAVWADVEFMKPLSLIGVLLSGVYFLGGWRNLLAAVGPLGFLLFMIPWPTSLVTRLAFPMQLLSSTYAAIICGLLGIPIERAGVHLSVTDGGMPANVVYKVVVAQQCSGLTSMMVLLALGYLIAYFTPIKLGWRALLMAVIVPLTLLCNSIRLSVILVAGAQYSASFAKWVHDNEGPVLIFFCSILLMAFRAGLLKYLESREKSEEAQHA